MAVESAIEWTNSTWNPITGCTKISPGCMNCYAFRMTKRLQAMGQRNYANGFNVTIHKHIISLPLTWKKHRLIFVNSMSDLFHEKVPIADIVEIINVMRAAHWHTFQVLTKRSERLLMLDKIIDWPSNVWVGVSVENRHYKYRIDHLRQTKAITKFVSIEPLIGPLGKLNLKKIDWVIAGGESGPKARPMHETWAIDIRNQCNMSGVPFFFKQWGGINKKKNGRLLQGRTWDEMPFKSSVIASY